MGAIDTLHVGTAWVAERLEDPNVRIVQTDAQPASYLEGHLPGAVFVEYTSVFMVPQDGVPMQLPPPEMMQQMFNQSGMTPDTTVVFYGDYVTTVGNKAVTRALWACLAYGHEKTAIMDGGKGRWQAEGRPMTQEQPVISPTAYGPLPNPQPDGDILATWEAVLASVDDANSVVIDVRRESEYTGVERQSMRGGRVPGAVHFPWESALEADGSLRPLDELRAEFEALGVTPDKTAITYCQGGVRASHTWFLLRHVLGYPSVQNYDGSWAEWGNRPDLPVET